MFRQFAQKMEEVRRLIEDSRSASSAIMSAEARFLLAVSGGMDSMCMADLCLQSLGADSFAVAHCNFSLRAEESDGDEALVREWAEQNGIELFVKRFDTTGYAQERGVSIEMAARELRYGWFAELCRERGFAAVVVAHNANDNAETLMLNLIRGTGLSGLHGMAETSVLTVGSENHLQCVVVRPLLEFTRKQIEGYVFARRVPYRHDSSNFSSEYKRNRIRNEVFPVFEKINPSFVRTLNREIGYFAEAGSIVEDWCRSHLPDVVREQDGTRLLQVNIPSLLTTPYWRYLLYYILEPYGFNSQTLASVESLLMSSRTVAGKRFESPTHILLTSQDTLILTDRKEDVEEPLDSDGVMVVRGAGTYSFNGSRFRVEMLTWSLDMPLKQPKGVLLMDADKMRFPFVCRRWRQGDWLVPLGMRGKKKVSDLFTDLKYDSLEKGASVIMVDTQTDGLAGQQHVAGLLGVRIDDRYKVTSSTRNVIRIISE